LFWVKSAYVEFNRFLNFGAHVTSSS